MHCLASELAAIAASCEGAFVGAAGGGANGACDFVACMCDLWYRTMASITMNESVRKDAVTNRFFHRRECDGVAECGSVGGFGGGDVGTKGMGMVIPVAVVAILVNSVDLGGTVDLFPAPSGLSAGSMGVGLPVGKLNDTCRS
jgi:hypothetical protein